MCLSLWLLFAVVQEFIMTLKCKVYCRFQCWWFHNSCLTKNGVKKLTCIYDLLHLHMDGVWQVKIYSIVFPSSVIPFARLYTLELVIDSNPVLVLKLRSFFFKVDDSLKLFGLCLSKVWQIKIKLPSCLFYRITSQSTST